MGELRIKRAYDPPAPDDGYRVLVDRLWPRGLSKEKADLDGWLKEIAPTSELRKWFGHDPARFDEFARRYRAELDGNPEAVGEALELVREKPRLTLVYAAHDEHANQAVVLRAYLDERAGKA